MKKVKSGNKKNKKRKNKKNLNGINLLTPSSDVACKKSISQIDEVAQAQWLANDSNLLERIQAQWQFGDWRSLVNVSQSEISSHPDRAKIAVYVAAGHLQRGNKSEAEALVKMAQEWGVNNRLVSQVLISGIHNSVARMASIMGDKKKGQLHFEKSIGLGLPGDNVSFLVKARARYQSDDIGLLPGSQGRLQEIAAAEMLSRNECIVSDDGKPLRAANADAVAFYNQLDKEARGGGPTPFIMLDSKSLPRSGLHYLKNTLAKILGEHFSFCEWYHEPGCCKSSPCALSGYATHSSAET